MEMLTHTKSSRTVNWLVRSIGVAGMRPRYFIRKIGIYHQTHKLFAELFGRMGIIPYLCSTKVKLNAQ